MNIEKEISHVILLCNQRSMHLSIEMLTRDATYPLLFDVVYKKVNILVWNAVVTQVYRNVRDCIKEYEY
jgi:hypothetical protein